MSKAQKKGLLYWLEECRRATGYTHTNPPPTTDPPAAFLRPAGSLWEEPVDLDSFTSFVTAGSYPIAERGTKPFLKCEYCGRLYRGEVLECPGCRAPVSIVADVRRPRQEPYLRPIDPGGMK